MSAAGKTRWQVWSEADLSHHQMLARAAEDLDEFESTVLEMRTDIRRMTAWLSAAALSFMGAMVAFVFNLVR